MANKAVIDGLRSEGYGGEGGGDGVECEDEDTHPLEVLLWVLLSLLEVTLGVTTMT